MVRRRRSRRKGRGRGKSAQRTVFKLIRLGALAAPAIAEAVSGKATIDKIADAGEAYTGYNFRYPERGWSGHALLRGWGPFLGACLATYGIPKLVGLIRRL